MSTQEKTTSPNASAEEGGAGWEPHSHLLRAWCSVVRNST